MAAPEFWKVDNLLVYYDTSNRAITVLIDTDGKLAQRALSGDALKYIEQKILSRKDVKYITATDAKALQQAAGRTYKSSSSSGGSSSVPAGTYYFSAGNKFVVDKDGTAVVYKKSGSVYKTYAPGSAGYAEFMSQVAADLKSGELSSSAPSSSNSSFQPSYTSSSSDYVPTGLQTTNNQIQLPSRGAITDEWWFWPAVAGGVFVFVGGVYLAFVRK